MRVVDEGQKAAGRYEVTWNGKGRTGEDVASGIYFYKVEAGDQKAVRKMLLLK